MASPASVSHAACDAATGMDWRCCDRAEAACTGTHTRRASAQALTHRHRRALAHRCKLPCRRQLLEQEQKAKEERERRRLEDEAEQRCLALPAYPRAALLPAHGPSAACPLRIRQSARADPSSPCDRMNSTT